jgi:DNA primase
MGIVDEDIVKVREASDIVAVVGEHLALKRVGRRWIGLCPFHGEKTPSFSVNQELGLYYCFGCQAKGDVITFVREIDHLDFAAAVESLARRSNITIRYTERGESEGRKQRGHLVDAVAAAVEWYHQRLLSADDAAKARSYLRSRGIDGETARQYQVGWAPEGWDELSRALKVPAEVMIDAGLSYKSSRGKLNDTFRGRVLFPIFDAQGDAVGFGGRILPGATGPKYKNSPETRIYQKSKVLYGLNWHKTGIVQSGTVVVCEGYTDVIGFARAGVPTAVATCGTALTEDHVRLLKRFASRVVLAFDADSAGQNAAARFYEWERTYEIEVAVAALPPGADPADLASSDPAALARSVDEAVPFLGFRLERVLSAADLRTPEGRARAAEAALDVISEHPNELVRDQYLMEVADRCRIDAERLRSGSVRRSPGRDPVASQSQQRRDQPARATPELDALRAALHEPAAVSELLDEELFADPVAASAFRALAGSQTFHEAVEGADPAAAELLQQLAVEELETDPVEAALRLVDDAVGRRLGALEAQARQSEDPLRFAADVGEAKLLIERLRESGTSPPGIEAAGQLLAWLQGTAEERDD